MDGGRRTFVGEGELAEVPADVLAVGGALGVREVLAARRAVPDRVLQPRDVGGRVPQRVRRRALRLPGGARARGRAARRRVRVPGGVAAPRAPALVRARRHARRSRFGIAGGEGKRGVESETGKRPGRWGRRGGPPTSGKMGMEVTGRDGGNVPPRRRIRRAQLQLQVRPPWPCVTDRSVGPVVVPNPFSVF